MAPPISHASGGPLPWFIRRPSRIVAALVAAAVAYLATSRLPDELNLLIPYDVAVAVYIALFGVFMQWASPEDAAEIARRGEPHTAPVMIAVIALSVVSLVGVAVMLNRPPGRPGRSIST